MRSESHRMRVAREPEYVQWQWHRHVLDTGPIFALTHWGVSHIPRQLSYAIGHVGTWLAFHRLKPATSALIENFRAVRPEATEDELRALALRTYRSYAREVIDFIRSLSMNRDQMASMMSPANQYHRVQRQGNGLLVLTGHIGNIELGAVIIRRMYDFPLTVVVLPEPDPRVNERRRRMRASLGIGTLEVGEGFDTALRIRRLLADNEAVALTSDRPLGRDRVEVEFFGRPTGFLRTPALMGSLTGAPMVPSFILRQADGRYAGIPLDPIFVPRTGNRDANVQAAMQKFATALEGVVREYPHLWYHFYPYWGADTERPEDDSPGEPVRRGRDAGGASVMLRECE